MQASRSLLFRRATRVCQAIAVEPSTSARGFYLATLPWRLAGDGAAVNQNAGARFLDSVDISEENLDRTEIYIQADGNYFSRFFHLYFSPCITNSRLVGTQA